MKTIVLDASIKPLNGTLAQAAKIFLAKNKTVSLVVTGRERDLNTLKQEKRLFPVPVLKAGEEEPSDPAFFLTKAQEVAKENNAQGILTLASKKEIQKLALSFFTERSLPLFVSSFVTRSPNRYCLLGDIGYSYQWKGEDYLKASIELKELIQKGFLLSHPTYSLVSVSEDPQDLPLPVLEAYEIFRGQEGFQGLTPVNRIMEGKSDIYLCDGFLGQSIVQAFSSSYHLFFDKYEAYRKEDFKAKLAFQIGKTMIQNINSQTSAFLDERGLLLLGFDTLLLQAKEEASLNDLVKSIDFLSSALDTLEEN